MQYAGCDRTAWEGVGIRVDVGRDPVTGRRRQLTRTLHGSKREAEEAVSRLPVEAGGGRYQGSGHVTLGVLLRDWMEHAKGNMEAEYGRRVRWQHSAVHEAAE